MEGLRLFHPLNAGSRPQATIPVGIALGSNEGDRLRHLKEARHRIMRLPQIATDPTATVLSAPVFETDPVDCAPGTAPFLNTVVEVACTKPFRPTDLLDELRTIEAELGRPTRRPRNASRTVDLDLLYAGELRVDLPGLTLPHPRLTQRRFVLGPLAAIRPGLVLPGQTRSVAELLDALPDQQEGVTPYAPHW